MSLYVHWCWVGLFAFWLLIFILLHCSVCVCICSPSFYCFLNYIHTFHHHCHIPPHVNTFHHTLFIQSECLSCRHFIWKVQSFLSLCCTTAQLLICRGAQAASSLGRHATWFSCWHFCSEKPSPPPLVYCNRSLLQSSSHITTYYGILPHFISQIGEITSSQPPMGSPSEWLLPRIHHPCWHGHCIIVFVLVALIVMPLCGHALSSAFTMACS